MPSLTIRDLPDDLRVRLKARATRHRRSVTSEALAILSEGLTNAGAQQMPPPYKGRFPLTEEFLNSAKREGRE